MKYGKNDAHAITHLVGEAFVTAQWPKGRDQQRSQVAALKI